MTDTDVHIQIHQYKQQSRTFIKAAPNVAWFHCHFAFLSSSKWVSLAARRRRRTRIVAWTSAYENCKTDDIFGKTRPTSRSRSRLRICRAVVVIRMKLKWASSAVVPVCSSNGRRTSDTIEWEKKSSTFPYDDHLFYFARKKIIDW